MLATVVVAVALSQLRQASGPGEALLISLFNLLPIPLSGLFLVKLFIPFVRRVRPAPPDRGDRRCWASVLWYDVAVWILAIGLALIVFYVFYFLIVGVGLLLFLPRGWY